MMVTGKNWKVRKDGKPKMDENTQARFDEKLTGLLAVARKKKMYWNIRKWWTTLPILQ